MLRLHLSLAKFYHRFIIIGNQGAFFFCKACYGALKFLNCALGLLFKPSVLSMELLVLPHHFLALLIAARHVAHLAACDLT